MKNYEKWWDKECFWRIDMEDYTSEVYAEKAWRAALEWVKSRSVHRLISVNEIEEELEDK